MRKDVIKTLGLNASKLKTFCTTTSRPNLHYEVLFTSDTNDTRFQSLLTWLHAIHARRTSNPIRSQELSILRQRPHAVSGIIYTSLRSDCESLAFRLRANKIGAAPYHAGLSSKERADCQQKWLNGEEDYDIIVATTAFGMGIDKQDVRFVVHWCLPKSFEGYYQEAGRAGRDGKAGACRLYYSREDRDRVAYRLAKDNAGRTYGGDGYEETAPNTQAQGRATSFQELVKYCEGTKMCRHQFIDGFFGGGNSEEQIVGGNVDTESPLTGCDFACDYCKDPQDLKRRKREGLASEEWVSTQSKREGHIWYGEKE